MWRGAAGAPESLIPQRSEHKGGTGGSLFSILYFREIGQIRHFRDEIASLRPSRTVECISVVSSY